MAHQKKKICDFGVYKPQPSRVILEVSLVSILSPSNNDMAIKITICSKSNNDQLQAQW